MKQKILALVMVLMTSLNCLTVFAQSAADEGWTATVVGSTNTDTSKAYAALNSSYSYAGSNSMQIAYAFASAVDGNYVELKNSLARKMKSGKYMLTFYQRTDFDDMTEICIGNLAFKKADLDSASSGNNWTKYSVIFDYTEQNEDLFAFRVYKRTKSMLIDGVSLIDLQGNEYITNGGFEESSDSFDTTPYRAKMFRLESYKTGAVLIWENPKSTELNKVSVYTIDSGGETLLDDTLDTTPSNIVRYEMLDSEAAGKRQYKIVFSYETKPDFVYYYGQKPIAAGSSTLGEWSVKYSNNGGGGYSEEAIVIDSSEAYDGTASVKLSSTNAGKSECYAGLYQTIDELEEGETYKISFRAKANNVASPPQIHMNFVPFDGQSQIQRESKMTGTYDWNDKLITYTYTVGSSKTLCFLIDHITEELWIDDVKCVKVGDETETNLIKDGSFENIASTEVGNLQNFTAEGKDKSIELSLKTTGDVEFYDFYEEISGNYEWRGTLSSDISSLLIGGLGNTEQHSYKIVPVNSDNYAGSAVTASAVTKTPDYVIENAVLRKYNSEGFATATPDMAAAGNYVISVDVTNNFVEGGMPAEVLVAVYNAQGVMTYLSHESVSAAEGKTQTASVNITVSDSGSQAEIIVLDSRSNLGILCDCIKLK